MSRHWKYKVVRKSLDIYGKYFQYSPLKTFINESDAREYAYEMTTKLAKVANTYVEVKQRIKNINVCTYHPAQYGSIPHIVEWRQ